MEHSDSGISAAAIIEPASSSSLETVAIFQPGLSKEAWLFLCAAFIMEALSWGMPLSYGVFQQYYGAHEIFNSNRENIAIVGSLALGTLYLTSPIITWICKQFPIYRRRMIVLGLFLLASSLIAASFATAIWQLILTQGLLYALGASFLNIPTLVLLDEWAAQRRVLAIGIVSIGTAVGGVIFPPVMSSVLHTYGMSTALRNGKVVLTGLLLPFIKPRIPVSSNLGISWSREIDFGFLRQPVFWFMETANIIQGAGYLIPIIFLPDYACSIGLSTLAASYTLSLLNASSSIGSIISFHLARKTYVTKVIFILTLGSAASVFLLWGFSTSKSWLYAFSIAYGLFAGGLSSCWVTIVGEFRRDIPQAEHELIFGLLVVGQGAGVIICGPLSGILLKWEPLSSGAAHAAYRTNYGPIILFTGITALVGGLGYIGQRLKLY